MIKPDTIYYGPRNAMLAEMGIPDAEAGAFLVLPTGAANWDAEAFSTLEAAKDRAEDIAAMNEGAQVSRI